MGRLEALLLAFLLTNTITTWSGHDSDVPLHVSLPCAFSVSQSVLNYAVNPIEVAQGVTSFYDYYSASAHTPYVEAYAGVFYLYLDTNIPAMYLVFHFNIDAAGSPDAVTTVGLTGVPAGAGAVLSDDPGPGSGAEFYMSRYPQGQFHYFENTDGGVLGPLPADKEWSMNVNVSHGGPDPMTSQKWVDWDGTRLPLSMTGTITVASECNRAPIADGGGPYAGFEGSSMNLNGGGSADPDNDSLTYRWDFESDGVFDTAWSSTPTVAHTWGDDWVGNVTLEVSDGKLTARDIARVTVLNVAPVVAFTTIPTGEEGHVLTMSATITDPGSDDIEARWTDSCSGPSPSTTYPNDPARYPDPDPSPDVNPRSVTDLHDVTCGDNGAFAWTLEVDDDDGGFTSLGGAFAVKNLPPTAMHTRCPQIVGCNATHFEGEYVDYWAAMEDEGSDDLSFTWVWGDGSPSEQAIDYNDGIGPDPPNSPGGTFPFEAWDNRSHSYGDDGVYTIGVLSEDDDGGSASISADVTILNLPPSLKVSPPAETSVDEGTSVTLGATASDPGSDDLTFTWRWDYGPAETAIFYNDGAGPDPPQSPGGTYPFIATDDSTHTYGDDCRCKVSLTVEDDDGGIVTYTTTVDVLNVPPSTVEDVDVHANGSLVLRVAGEKYHDVTATVFLSGIAKYTATIVRVPGSPDDQTVTIGNITMDLTCSDTWSAMLAYTPLDDPINGRVWGATPAWLVFRSTVGTESKIHHTFNARHEDTWIWDVPDLKALLVGIPLDFRATATDLGSDDLTFIWDWGDGTPATATIYYNDGVNPDPYPSPDGTFPFTTTETQTHSYMVAGIFVIELTVTDDDGGSIVIPLNISLG